MPLSRLIALIINAHPWGVGSRQEIQRDGHRQKNLLCFDLPVVGGQAPQPRLAANYKQIPSFTMSISDTHAFSGGETGLAADRPYAGIHNGDFGEVVEPDGIEPTT